MHEPLSAMGPPHNAMNLQPLGSKCYDYFTGPDARWVRMLGGLAHRGATPAPGSVLPPSGRQAAEGRGER